jgi:hypothetical protein
MLLIIELNVWKSYLHILRATAQCLSASSPHNCGCSHSHAEVKLCSLSANYMLAPTELNLSSIMLNIIHLYTADKCQYNLIAQ